MQPLHLSFLADTTVYPTMPAQHPVLSAAILGLLESGPPASQGARDHIGRAQQCVTSLRAGLQKAFIDVRIPDAGLIVTPALVDTLSKTHQVQTCTPFRTPAPMQRC